MIAGAKVGRWELVSEVARGGAGSVWRARDGEGREAALKLLLAGRAASAAQRARFVAEARALTRIEDPDVVRVLDAGEDHGVPYLAMELVQGPSLQERLDRSGPLPPAEASDVCRSLALALDRLHRQGVVHRDLKPANVLLREGGRPVLTDFGLALELSEAERLTVTGQVMGTPGYWSPEQAQGRREQVGPASDVWGLGATLHALLTGSPPFGRPENLIEALRAMERAPPPPSAVQPGIDPRLDAVVASCLQLDPARRPPDARAVARMLAARARPPARLRAWQLVLGAACLFLGGAGVGRWTAPSSEPAQAAAPAAVAPPASDASREWATRLAEAEVRAGHLHRVAGDHAAAREAFERALAADQDHAPAWVGRGILRGTPAERAADLDRAIALDPRLVAAWAYRAVIHEEQGDLHAAIAAFDRAIEVDPASAMSISDRGRLKASLGDVEGALADYDRAVEANPRLWQPLMNRGSIRHGRGELEASLEDWRRARACIPAGHPAVQELERLIAGAEQELQGAGPR